MVINVYPESHFLNGRKKMLQKNNSIIIPESKRLRIINAGLKEFCEKGYERGSTTNICREAKISKGLLFHYFESKLGFYNYLIDYSSDVLKGMLNSIERVQAKSFKEFIELLVEILIKFWRQHPQVLMFTHRVKFDQAICNSELLFHKLYIQSNTIMEKFLQTMPDVKENIDPTIAFFIFARHIESIFESLFFQNTDFLGLSSIGQDLELIKTKICQLTNYILYGILINYERG
jgi:AcrR family transcriptional regulator